LVDFLLFAFKFLTLFLKTGFIQSLLKSHGPDELDAEKCDLGGVLVGEFTKSLGHAVLVASLADVLHSALHFLFDFEEPVFDVAFGFDTFNKHDVFLRISKGTMDRDYKFTVNFIECNSVDLIEQLFEVILDGVRI